MKNIYHKLSVVFYNLVIIVTVVYLHWLGTDYYHLPIEKRFFDPMYALLKPSGLVGHGLGILGTIIMMIGLFAYMLRKRYRIFFDWGHLKYWLEFHIFMCTLGPILILYHTTFKFGGIISVAFWSMVVVWLSGVIGRYLYIHIPHAIDGRSLTLKEVQEMKAELELELINRFEVEPTQISSLLRSRFERKKILSDVPLKKRKKIEALIKQERKINRRIRSLTLMHKLFGYWHIVHLPFTFILIIIATIHIAVELYFGFFWVLSK